MGRMRDREIAATTEGLCERLRSANGSVLGWSAMGLEWCDAVIEGPDAPRQAGVLGVHADLLFWASRRGLAIHPHHWGHGDRLWKVSELAHAAYSLPPHSGLNRNFTRLDVFDPPQNWLGITLATGAQYTFSRLDAPIMGACVAGELDKSLDKARSVVAQTPTAGRVVTPTSTSGRDADIAATTRALYSRVAGDLGTAALPSAEEFAWCDAVNAQTGAAGVLGVAGELLFWASRYGLSQTPTQWRPEDLWWNIRAIERAGYSPPPEMPAQGRFRQLDLIAPGGNWLAAFIGGVQRSFTILTEPVLGAYVAVALDVALYRLRV